MISCGDKSLLKTSTSTMRKENVRDDDDDDDDDNVDRMVLKEEADREECNLLSLQRNARTRMI